MAPGHTLPLVSDGVVHRVLQNLLVLDGERLSYRSLDVEQIGSVYEAMMGFRLEVTSGRPPDPVAPPSSQVPNGKDRADPRGAGAESPTGGSDP